MWNTIRIRIFLPTILILILLPVSMFAIIYSVSKNHTEQEAAIHTDTLITYIQNEALSISESAPELTKEQASELLSHIREYMRNQQPQANLLIYNGKLEEIYPTKEKDSALLSEYWQNWLHVNEPQPDTLYLETIDQDLYAVKYCRTFNQNRTSGRYYVAFKAVPSARLLLSQTTCHLIILLSVLFLISLSIVWKISNGIVRSIEKLSRETKHIGIGQSELKQMSFSVKELELLRQSFCAMEERLETSQKEKEQIFQNISHDLKTPLASIIGFTTGLSNGITKEPQKAYDIILEESFRMNRMLDGILTLSKLDTHSWVSNCHPVNLEDFLLEQMKIAKGSANELELLLQPRTAFEENLSITTDTELLTRIVQNIFSNCIRYAKHTICIQLAQSPAHAIITISDDGPGIAPEHIAHICERCYRGSEGKHGIGMAIVKAGMEHLGGYMEVSSKNGAETGAVFRLHLPLQL